MRALAVLVLVGLSACGRPEASEAETDAATEPQFGFAGALDLDCTHGGRNANGVEVFIVPCPRDVASPDGRWRLVHAGDGEAEGSSGDYVFIEEPSGKRIGPVPGLSDGMPFAMFWSPRPNWFFVEHHAGSFMQVPEVFEITPGGVVSHEAFVVAGQDAARERFPCLPETDHAWANGNVMGWSMDGRRLAWVLRTRIDVCMEPGQTGSVRDDQVVHPLVMVSDIETGRVIEESIIVLDDEASDDFTLPDAGSYRDIVKPN